MCAPKCLKTVFFLFISYNVQIFVCCCLFIPPTFFCVLEPEMQVRLSVRLKRVKDKLFSSTLGSGKEAEKRYTQQRVIFFIS